MGQSRGHRHGVIPALVLAVALLAWIAGSRSGELRVPTASSDGQQGTTIESAITLLVVTSDRPRITVAANRHTKARAVAALTSVSSDDVSPRSGGSDVDPAAPSISIGLLSVGLTRRGPPVAAPSHTR